MQTTTRKVPVSERALVARIRRWLEPQQLGLVKLRSLPGRPWGVVHPALGREGGLVLVIATAADLFMYARKLGAVKPWEELAS